MAAAPYPIEDESITDELAEEDIVERIFDAVV